MEARDNKKIFLQYNVKNTRQRNAVFDVLNGVERPMTAEQIFMKVKEVDASLSLSTVYRILDVFIDKKLVIKTSLTEENKALYERNRMDHKHYLVCTDCKKVVPMAECPLHSLEEKLRDNTGFEITGHKLELYGRCLDCKQS